MGSRVIILVNSNAAATAAYEARLPRSTGILINPTSGVAESWAASTGLPWALENGAFSGRGDFAPFWDAVGRCRRLPSAGRLLFVVAPDVFDAETRRGNAEATLARYPDEADRLAGLPVAVVLQDGAEGFDLVTVLSHPATTAVFVGGSDDFKLSAAAADLCAEARSRGLWCHMGRVNSGRRIRYARINSCDSVDGTGLTKFYRAKLGIVVRELKQPLLFSNDA